jgi:hypothetical protein
MWPPAERFLARVGPMAVTRGQLQKGNEIGTKTELRKLSNNGQILWKPTEPTGEIAVISKSYITMRDLGLETPPETEEFIGRLLDKELRVLICGEAPFLLRNGRFVS